MPPSIEPTLFDFIEEFAANVAAGDVGKSNNIDTSSPIITFCESLFEQFFANVVGRPITGFDPASKRKAAEAAERLKLKNGSPETRGLIALYEKFCDLYGDVVGGDYGRGGITYGEFNDSYMSRLLQRVERWAISAGEKALADRIRRARSAYETAIRDQEW